MDVETGLFLAVATIAATVFLWNVTVGRTWADRLNSGVAFGLLPFRRPRVLGGRRLVAVWFAAALAVLATGPGDDGWLLDPVLPEPPFARLAALLLLAAAQFVTVGYKGSLAQQVDAELDERERAIRDRVYLYGYRIVTSLVAIVIVAALLVSVPGFPGASGFRVDLDPAVLHDHLLVAVLALWAIPSLVHAWIDPRSDEPLPEPVPGRGPGS